MLPRISCFSTGGPAAALMGSSCWKWQKQRSRLQCNFVGTESVPLEPLEPLELYVFLALFNQQMYFAMFWGLWLGSFFFFLSPHASQTRPGQTT